jgi:hypothetical protein
MIGTLLNVAGILAGGTLGLIRPRPLPLASQMFCKSALGAFTVLAGLRLTWQSTHGTPGQVLGQVGIVLLAIVLGRLTGRILHLQKLSNRLGQTARKLIATAHPNHPDRFQHGFTTCSLLFCAAPLGILGAIQDGLVEYHLPLIIKTVMDALATMSFAAMFGPGVFLSALPVLIFQGTITLACALFLQPFLLAHALLDPVNAAGGLLLVCLSLIIFEIKRVEVTDYLPSLILAPLLSWLFR